MGELSIKIKIADREYPMRIDSSEEERLRLAGKMVNEKLKHYRDQFGIDDKQDLLAMVAFDCMVERMKTEAANSSLTNNITTKISYLDGLVSEAIDR
ncbi:MAG: cell division protein ZapA [Cytophagaceae bacterium]|nr:cell division protein ZapA [Cytophagaceae bacterium]